MTIYSYVALKNNRDIVKGKVEANDLRSAREAIRKSFASTLPLTI